MYVCVCVCMCVCMYVCMYIYMHRRYLGLLFTIWYAIIMGLVSATVAVIAGFRAG